ncbi:MAG: M28 family peptidase [Actinomycetota bacterium]
MERVEGLASKSVPDESTLRDVIDTLAELDRTPCSPGEREAALWLQGRLASAGCASVDLEEEPGWGPFPPTLTTLGIAAIAAATLVARGRRVAGGLAALAAAVGIIDEAQNGPRLFRRAIRRRRTTVNVVARTGDPGATRTLVVLAHHDAPQTGLIFNQRLEKAAYELAPEYISRIKTGIPQWWGLLAGPLFTVMSAVTGRKARAGLLLSTLATTFLADIWRSPTVPGANDNLSGVASLVALAEMIEDRPPAGLRVLLVSCGSEETLQDGIRAFMERHRGELDRGNTWVLNLDTVGSPHLVLLEGEGPVWMEDYTDPSFRDMIARAAIEVEVDLERDIRTRASTDAIIPSRRSYPTATLLSIEPWRLPANYHLLSDTPANVNYETVVNAVRIAYAVARRLSESQSGAVTPAQRRP